MENAEAGKVISVEERFARPNHVPIGVSHGRTTCKEAGELCNKVATILIRFTRWLDSYGETSWDHQSFFAGPIGGKAKALYYRYGTIGTAAVAPIILCEAFLPWTRRFFHHRIRFPIADAHYAMGFVFLHQAIGKSSLLERACHFLDELEKSRAPGFEEYCWGYPFDWVTRGGLVKKDTPLITTTPYVFEAFLQGFKATQRAEWKQVLASIARHARFEIKDFETSPMASSCSYSPFDGGGVINAAAYRAFLLFSASQFFSNDDYRNTAERNLNFVLEAQNPDGSWYYAVDGVRDFVDHFHTCFVMKALGKIYAVTRDERCYNALAKGTEYYLKNLFDEEGLPKPFSKAPRLTVYKRELYDCAECINLGLVLRKWFPRFEKTVVRVIKEVTSNWVKPDGSFRSRRLHLGWDSVPMHRWGQSQMFRALAFYLAEATKMSGKRDQTSDVRDQKAALAS